jgi:hypothetical protein
MTDFDDAIRAIDAHVGGDADGASLQIDDGEKQGIVTRRRLLEPALKALAIFEWSVR